MAQPAWHWNGRSWSYWDGQRWLAWDGRNWLIQGAIQPTVAAPRRNGLPAAIVGLAVVVTVLLLGAGAVGLVAVAVMLGGDRPTSRTTADPAYRDGIDFAIDSLNEYWSATLPEFDATKKWVPPTEYLPYSTPGETGPDCGSEPATGQEIAYYCSLGNRDYVAWDESYMIGLFEDPGPMANWVVLAHEFGHAAQATLWLDFNSTADKELQADCFAGAWAGWAAGRGLLPGDANEQASEFYLDNGDVQGNTAEGLLAAYRNGLEGGAARCYSQYVAGGSG